MIETDTIVTTAPAFKLQMPAIRIAPSLLAADFAQLGDQLALVENGGADLLHLDVMDGHFVPNISFGPCVIESLRAHSKLFFDAHLMIDQPQRYAEAFVKAGCDHITFHIEATDKPQEVIESIRTLGASVGICINPTTPVSAIESVISDVDMVLVMSVWPGFGGQAFIPDVLASVRHVKSLLGSHQRLEIDGGIDGHTIAAAAGAGVDTFVAGSAIFRAPDPVAAMNDLRSLANQCADSDTPDDDAERN